MPSRGFEPLASGSASRRSIQLSYEGKTKNNFY